jgi:Cytidylate kinase
MQLPDLGERICILGPSNSGKSTLAEAIARKRGLQAVHSDQLYDLCMPQRFLRAINVILLVISTPASLFRYCGKGPERPSIEAILDFHDWLTVHAEGNAFIHSLGSPSFIKALAYFVACQNADTQTARTSAQCLLPRKSRSFRATTTSARVRQEIECGQLSVRVRNR